jgi:2-(1,2-epoxy-1,2-dihydrophenyl)acetyl-CoA isomerase
VPSPPYAVRTDAGVVATVTLDRPGRLNAFTGPDIVQLRDVVAEVAEDGGVRAVVLTGAGTAFCAGGDLRAMVEGPVEGDEPLPPMRRLVEVVELLHGMPKVTVAAIDGPCAGAGLSLATACDVRISSSTAVFTTAFAKVGQSGDYGGAWFLSRLVGPSRAAAMLLLSPRYDAASAAELGLVDEVVDDALSRATAIAEQVGALAPLTLAAIKENLHDAQGSDLSTYLDRECERFHATLATHDAMEAVRAYLEQREPRFEGR